MAEDLFSTFGTAMRLRSDLKKHSASQRPKWLGNSWDFLTRNEYIARDPQRLCGIGESPQTPSGRRVCCLVRTGYVSLRNRARSYPKSDALSS